MPAISLEDRMGESMTRWRSLQCFGVRTPAEQVNDADIISTMDFDQSGDYLATGDKGGRVVVFERHHFPEPIPSPSTDPSDSPTCKMKQQQPLQEFRYLTELESHLPEFDYLRSLEIEEKINKIRWCRSYNSSKLLLSTNDKTIKLWRVSQQKLKHVSNFNFAVTSKSVPELRIKTSAASDHKSRHSSLIGAFRDENDLDLTHEALKLPKVVTKENVIHTKNLRVFGNAHAYHINSVSVNSDQETFISADDLRINLWNLEISHTSFNIVDLKPKSIEDLTEVITCVECHPDHCFMFGYSSSKGLARLVDMRQRALCDYADSAIQLCGTPDNGHSLFSEIINSISDLKFSGDGRYLLTRDYLTLKLWDLSMTQKPVHIFDVHDNLRGKLYDLYECDRIFDKFTCALSRDGQHVMTGTYAGYFRVFGLNDGLDLWVNVDEEEPNFDGMHHQRRQPHQKESASSSSPFEDVDVTNLSLADNIYQMAWHPTSDVAAIGASNSFYVFSAY